MLNVCLPSIGHYAEHKDGKDQTGGYTQRWPFVRGGTYSGEEQMFPYRLWKEEIFLFAVVDV